MLRTTKLMKDKYEKIQRYLFSMIPEKWDEIYLYASGFAGAIFVCSVKVPGVQSSQGFCENQYEFPSE